MTQVHCGLWMASIGHKQIFFLEKPYGTARPRKDYFHFISLVIKKKYFILLFKFFVQI